jgi:hypothetical protein
LSQTTQRLSPVIFLQYNKNIVIPVVWACAALYWLVATSFFRGNDYMFWDADDKILKSVLAAIILDLVLAGSELFHKVRLYFLKDTKVEDQVSML